jgi:hypothetical protein
MPEDTEIITKGNGAIPGKDSTFLGISVRAWLAIVLVATVCASHLSVCIGVLWDAVKTADWSKVGTYTNIGEPLYSMSVAALGFYFGQKTNKP